MTDSSEMAAAGGTEAVSAAMLRRVELTTVRRGYDPAEVTALVQAAADALDEARAESVSLRAHLAEVEAGVAELEPLRERAREVEEGRAALESGIRAAEERHEAQLEDLQRLTATAQAIAAERDRAIAELDSMRAQVREADERRSSQDGELESLRAAVAEGERARDAALAERDAARAETEQARGELPPEQDLMSMVGASAGTVLAAAQESAAELKADAHAEAERMLTSAQATATETVSAAEEEALEYRRASQERADAIVEEARRESDALRADAQTGARLLSEEAEHDTTELRRAADEYAETTRREADHYAGDTRAAADRDARRIVTEAQGVADAKVAAAEALVAETRDAVDARMRELNGEMAAFREHELNAIAHMRDVREALTQHLFATQGGLEDVLNQVVSDDVPELVSGEIVDPEPEVGEEPPAAGRIAKPRGGRRSG
jgi:DNA repair exonuclease SbcCD ATPase subunit